jgi:hypothetical protein
MIHALGTIPVVRRSGDSMLKAASGHRIHRQASVSAARVLAVGDTLP